MAERRFRVVGNEESAPKRELPGPDVLEEYARCCREMLSHVAASDAWLRDFLAARLRHAELLLTLESLPKS